MNEHDSEDVETVEVENTIETLYSVQENNDKPSQLKETHYNYTNTEQRIFMCDKCQYLKRAFPMGVENHGIKVSIQKKLLQILLVLLVFLME